MDIHPIETILKSLSISQNQWETIQKLERFKQLLERECEAWGAALNAGDRVKVKAAAALEDWLPELSRSMHDPQQGLNHRIEGGKLLAKLAGMGLDKIEAAGGPGFHLEIHIGDGKPRVTQVTQKVIEGTATEIHE